jgi:SAM-dependent methyltransferase
MSLVEPIDFIDRWRRIVEERRRQTDDAYARLGRTTRDYWARRAGRFAAFSREGHPDPFLDKVMAHVDRDSMVLDVGAGTGRHTVPLARVVRRVFGVEPSPAMAAQLREWAQDEGLTNIELIEGTWPGVDAPACDAAICSHVLYPIAEIEPFLRKLDGSARRFCFLWLHDDQMALESLGLWERFHGEPRAAQPTFRDVLPVLWQMGLRPNLEMSVIPENWSWEGMDEAAPYFREHLAIPEDEATEARLREMLAAALVEREGRLCLPRDVYRSAIVWWGRENVGAQSTV